MLDVNNNKDLIDSVNRAIRKDNIRTQAYKRLEGFTPCIDPDEIDSENPPASNLPLCNTQ